MNEPITMFKKQFNFLSMAVHPFPNSRFMNAGTANVIPVKLFPFGLFFARLPAKGWALSKFAQTNSLFFSLRVIVSLGLRVCRVCLLCIVGNGRNGENRPTDTLFVSLSFAKRQGSFLFCRHFWFISCKV